MWTKKVTEKKPKKIIHLVYFVHQVYKLLPLGQDLL